MMTRNPLTTHPRTPRRGMQAVGACLALLVTSAIHAQADKPADYDVVAPAPWVEVVPLPALRSDAGATSQGAERFLLVDRQVRIDAASYNYFHAAVRILTQAGVESHSQIKLDFDPQQERLHLHAVTVRRGDQSVDQLKAGRIEILHRESGLENGLIDGQLTFHLLLADVRVGDIVEYSYTLEHRDPEWGNRHFAHFTTRWDMPIDSSRLRIWSRQKAPLYVLNHDGAQPARRSVDGWQSQEWAWKDLAAMTTLDDAPEGFEQHPSIEVSQFANWKDVAAAALPLYATAGPGSPERIALLERLRAAGATDAERALAVIRFVQEEVRYTGIELGQGAYRPRPPDEVLAGRYGDCKDKSLLAVTLLRGLGIEADPVLVSTHWRRHVRERLASPGTMNHVIVRARVADVLYWFDVTRTAQGGDLAHVAQADLGAGLVIAPSTTDLTDMPPARSERSRIVVSEVYDLTEGVDKEAGLVAATLYRESEADWMRRRLRNTTPEKLSQDYLNYYKGRYDSIRAVGPVQVRDDMQANELTVFETYRIGHPFTLNRKGRMELEVDGYLVSERLKAPSRPVRTIPLALDNPCNVTHQIVVRMPDSWPIKEEYTSVPGPGFRFDAHTSLNGNDVLLDYRYRTSADQVSVGQLAEFLQRREEARGSTSYSLSYDPHPAASTKDVDKAEAALRESGELAQKGEADKATQALQALLNMPGYPSLSAEQRHAALFLAAALAFDRRDWPQALDYLRQSSLMDDATVDDWDLRFRAAVAQESPTDAALALTEITRRWPDKLRAMDDELVARAVANTPRTGSVRFGLLKSLYDAHYVPPSGFDLSWWWLELGRRQLERGDTEAAVAPLKAVRLPHAMIQILADNRFAPVRAQLGPMDVAAAARRNVEATHAASARSPREIQPFLMYVDALLDMQRSDEALAELDAVIARVAGSKDHGGYSDYGRSYPWVLDMRSRALQALGRWDEAVAQLIEASHLQERSSENVSQVINLAGLYNQLGRPRDALDALAALVAGNQSPYGRAQVANESLSAALQMGNQDEAERQLAYLKEHQADSPRTYQVALVHANRLDEAAALLMSRLANPDQRSDALMDLQDYVHGADTARDREFMRVWHEIRARPDVAAAIGKVGSIGTYPVLGVSF